MSGQVGLDLGDAAPPLLPMATVSGVSKATMWSGDRLLQWAWRKGREGQPIQQASQPGRTRGNVAHTVLQALLRGDPVHPEQEEPSHRPYMDGILTWHRSTGARLLGTEITLTDPHRRVTGRLDYIRECPGCEVCNHHLAGGGVIVGDVKTGDLRAGRSSQVQVSGYRHLWEETPVAARPERRCCCGGEVLGIDARGHHRVTPAVATAAMFLRALAWYRDMESIPDPFA